ncbi:MAG: EI24 domain-containing protein [Bacteroidetes bacterium]|nr:EI24 domain-containing protein [Bacteroidota bacterium]
MIKDIFSSISVYGKAINLITTHNLWRFVIIPGLVSVAVMLLLALGPGMYFANSDLDATLAGMIPWEWLQPVAEIIADSLVFMLTLLLIFFVGKYIILIVASPFMGALSEKVEAIVTGRTVPSDSNFVQDLVRGIRISLRNLIREIFLTLLFLLFNLVPVIGSLIGAILTFAVEAYYAGFGNMDYTLERKRYNVSQSVQFVSENRGVAIGNGVVFLGLLLIPVIGWFLAPAFATVAATVMCLEKLKQA